MPGLNPEIDPDGLLEYSVVFTDRSLNHMSKRFQEVMRDISATLKEVYNARSVALVPGGGTCAMEAVARQFATGRHAMVIRNGFFSYRWSQIFEMGRIPARETVLMARRTGNGATALRPAADRGSGAGDPRNPPRHPLCAACGNRLGHDPAR